MNGFSNTTSIPSGSEASYSTTSSDGKNDSESYRGSDTSNTDHSGGIGADPGPMARLPKRCLILAALQNIRLSSKGSHLIHEDSRGCLSNIVSTARAFHREDDVIYWIQPELVGDSGSQSPLIEIPDLEASTFLTYLIAENLTNSRVLTNIYALLEDIRAREITEIYVGGLADVLAKDVIMWANKDLSLDVTVIEDCLVWQVWNTHEQFLEEIRAGGVRVKLNLDYDYDDFDFTVSDVSETSSEGCPDSPGSGLSFILREYPSIWVKGIDLPNIVYEGQEPLDGMLREGVDLEKYRGRSSFMSFRQVSLLEQSLGLDLIGIWV